VKKEVMETWVEALRSGNYIQTTNSLCDEYGFCCLGVLCDCAGSDIWEFLDEDTQQMFYHGENEKLPDQVVEWAGIKTGFLPTVEWKGQKVGLHELNDDLCLNFNLIADLIEQQYKEI
jgi:hypothetical protein